eukprot:361808-Chlamydomonas_euryale.AAC.7
MAPAHATATANSTGPRAGPSPAAAPEDDAAAATRRKAPDDGGGAPGSRPLPRPARSSSLRRMDSMIVSVERGGGRGRGRGLWGPGPVA